MAKIPDDLFLIEPPDDLKQLYYAIGRIIVNWSLVERMLANCVIILYSSYWGSELPGIKEIPVSLNRQIAFVRKALNNTEMPLLPFKDEGEKLMDRIQNLKDVRHNITHGMLVDMDKDSFDIQKFKYDKRTFDDLKINVKVDDCLESGNKMLVLANELGRFFRHLLRQE
jgi:hypothetical protein